MKNYLLMTIDAGANRGVDDKLPCDLKTDDSARATPMGFTSLSFAIIKQFDNSLESIERETAGVESRI